MSTYVKIASNTLGSNTASVVFSSIPSTYTDLLLKFSVRTSETGFTNDQMRIRYNGQSTSLYSYTYLRGDGSSVVAYGPGGTETGMLIALVNSSASTANVYSNGEIYIPNYLSSAQKPSSLFTAMEQNNASALLTATAGLGTATTALSSITFYCTNGSDFLTTSSFYLYGISNA